MSGERLRNVVEAALLAAGRPLSTEQLLDLFEGEPEPPSRNDLRQALDGVRERCEGSGIELVEVGSGYRLQVRREYSGALSRLWAERPPRYTRALLETLALIAYRQPITRGEIEDVRGVSVSTSIIKTLQERDWIRVLGHRDVPGRPALYGTTRAFLDSFNLKSLEDLPPLSEIRDIDNLDADLFADLPAPEEAPGADDGAAAPVAGEATSHEAPTGFDIGGGAEPHAESDAGDEPEVHADTGAETEPETEPEIEGGTGGERL